MTKTRTHRLLTGAVLAALTATTLAGCAGETDAEWSYPTATAARTSSESGRVPGFLPSDAQDVRLHARLQGYGAQLRWRSADGITAPYCERGPITGGAESKADWWPSTASATGWDCGTWNVFERADVYYAWDTRAS